MPEQPAGPAGPGRPRRRVSPPALAWRQFRRAPVTVCFLAAVWAAGLGSGAIAHGPSRWLSAHAGAGLTSLGHGYWWTPLSAGLWASGLGGYLAVTVLGLLALAPAERRMGSTRTITALLAAQAAGVLLAAALTWLAGLAGEPWLSALTGETAVGALPGLLGVGFALSGTLSPLWRRRLRLLLTAAVTISALYLGHLEQVAQVCGAAAGLAAMALTCGRARPAARPRASQREVRALVATLVAVSALGGLLAALVADPDGPMSLFSPLAAAPGPDPRALAAACPHPALALACRGLREQQLYAGW